MTLIVPKMDRRRNDSEGTITQQCPNKIMYNLYEYKEYTFRLHSHVMSNAKNEIKNFREVKKKNSKRCFGSSLKFENKK